MENKVIKLMTADEAAGFLNIKKPRLRRAIFKREVKYIKLGALIRFKHEHLNEWIRRQTIEPAA